MTRRSRTIASSILRKLSACASWRLLNWIWSSLVTPSTISATSFPKRAAISSLGVGRVFDDVVQDRRDQRVGVEVQFGQDFRGRHRMGDVRLAAQALLAQVGGGAEFGRGTHALDLFGRQVGADLAQQVFEARGASRAGKQAQ